MLTRLFLVRHGEVDAAWRDRIYGRLDVPLSKHGEQQARDAAARIMPAAPAAVISSDLARAIFGAAEIARPLGIPHERDPALHEIDRGSWAGRRPAELIEGDRNPWRDWQRAPSDTRPPDGESLRDVAQRVLPRIGHWAEAYSGQSVAIVAHLWVLRVAVCASLAVNLDAALRLAVATGETVVIDWPVGESAGLRPTLVGFGIDAVPAGQQWFRGPHRDASNSKPSKFGSARKPS